MRHPNAQMIVSNNRFRYNGNEEQQIGGLDVLDYGARMYDPAIGRFHTQDRFAEKYLSMTPYQYGANNPVSFIDVNGDSLDVANNEISRTDINALVKEKNQGYISYDGDRLSLDFGDMSKRQVKKALRKDKGLSLLNDLSSASENYLYEASTSDSRQIRSSGEIITEDVSGSTNVLDAISNYSVTPRNIDGGAGGQDFAPAQPGVDGYVRISPGSFKVTVRTNQVDGTSTTNDVSTSRSSIVFHELSESYNRTTLKQPDIRTNGSGAHRNAVKREGTYYGNYPGRASIFIPQ
jgi:RHS repeat-associated protein